ncbi:hypothetical protein AB1Y20_010494 [Prymnesium parvum]|uniref:ATP-dependent RNA helicase n=1 Tax=Prymnesium parvum TaxID=97485 RepID=A0AB34IRK3_PRYPA
MASAHRRTSARLMILLLPLGGHALSPPVRPRAATIRMDATPPCLFSQLADPPPPEALALLERRGIAAPTPIQALSYERLVAGEHLLLHAETGSGKTLAMLLPLLRRTAACGGAKLLVLSPTRELAAQLADEAAYLLRGGALGPPSVALLAAGVPADVEKLCGARLVVATPPELCALLADGTPTEAASGSRRLADGLAAGVRALVLDEVDALVPGLKEFRGKRHFKWMDKGMHPAEGVVKMLMRRSTHSDIQVVAASATLDRSTRRKVEKLLRASPVLRAAGRDSFSVASTLTTAGGARTEDMPTERVTLVPEGIAHFLCPLSIDTTTDGTAAAVAALDKIHRAREGEDDGASLVFVSSRSTYLGGAHAIASALRGKGLEAAALSDALWPGSTRAVKRQPRAKQRQERFPPRPLGGGALLPGPTASAQVQQSMQSPAAADESVMERRQSLNAQMRGSPSKLVVADAAATRGLHLDAVTRVYILGLPANADSYLHLCGRTGRWPRTSRAEVVTLATSGELRTLKGWASGWGVSLEAL